MCKWLRPHAVAAHEPGIGRGARQAGTPHRGAPAARAARRGLTPGTGGAIVGRSGTAPGTIALKLDDSVHVPPIVELAVAEHDTGIGKEVSWTVAGSSWAGPL